MKSIIALLLVIILFCLPTLASADLTTKTNDPADFSLSDCYNLVGEEIMMEMIYHAATNAPNRDEYTLHNMLSINYAPALYGLIDTCHAESIDPWAPVYREGDSSISLANISNKLYALGYISSPTNTFTPEVKAAIRKIQFCAGHPIDGTITEVLVRAFDSDSIPSYETTMLLVDQLAEDAIEDLGYTLDHYLSIAKRMAESPYSSQNYYKYADGYLYEYSCIYIDAEKYIPDHITDLNLQEILINPSLEKSFTIAHNFCGLLANIAYCAQYEIISDIAKP